LTDSINGLLRLSKENEASIEKQETLLHVIRQYAPPSKYFSAGSLDISKYRHTGFGASICTVFTEPVHNYASIHVQRQLTAVLKGEEQESENFDTIDKIARHCNSSYSSKIAAEQDSKKLYTAAYIYRQCLNTEVKRVITEAFAIHFDTDLVHLYIPDYDLELPVLMNEKSIPGGHHAYDSTLNEMGIIWHQKTEEVLEKNDADVNEKSTQKLKFLSRINIGMRVDMKVVRPIFEIEFLK
jgi:protein SSD1